MTELPSIPQRVEKGIAWLEEQGADDWAEKIVAAVEESRFNIWDGCRCAVGVTLGAYATVATAQGADAYEFGSPYGFDTPHFTAFPGRTERDQVSARSVEMNALEREWERKARDHAAYRAEILG